MDVRSALTKLCSGAGGYVVGQGAVSTLGILNQYFHNSYRVGWGVFEHFDVIFGMKIDSKIELALILTLVQGFLANTFICCQNEKWGKSE